MYRSAPNHMTPLTVWKIRRGATSASKLDYVYDIGLVKLLYALCTILSHNILATTLTIVCEQQWGYRLVYRCSWLLWQQSCTHSGNFSLLPPLSKEFGLPPRLYCMYCMVCVLLLSLILWTETTVTQASKYIVFMHPCRWQLWPGAVFSDCLSVPFMWMCFLGGGISIITNYMLIKTKFHTKI